MLVCRSMGDAQGVLFRDDFTTAAPTAGEPVSGEWSVVDGAYVQIKLDMNGYQTFCGRYVLDRL